MKQYWNKTKVICTIGPACANRSVLKAMLLAGMDIARFNFSHGLPSEHISLIKIVKSMAESIESPLAVLQDLPGPKIRIGSLENNSATLKPGQDFFLTDKKITGNTHGVYVNNKIFIRELQKKDIVYLNDGLVKLTVVAKKTNEVLCKVVTGGIIYPRKGVSSPNRFLNMDAVTPYDFTCLEHGIKAGIDFVAVSFVQRAKDVLKIKNYLKRKNQNIFVIAKIERKTAFEDMDQIIKVSDAIMVARGDLGIDADLEEVPFLQKEIIAKCNVYGKPVITATQMLESMVNSLQPTRAEVTDVANAILDGSDALMLSEETAIGKYPLTCLQTMVKIAAKTEEKMSFALKTRFFNEEMGNLVEALSHSAVDVAQKIKAKAIIVPTKNAASISYLSRLRPASPVAGITTDEKIFKQLILFWGVFPILIKKFKDLQQTLHICVQLIRSYGLAEKKDNVVIMLTNDDLLFSSNLMEVRKIK